MNKKASGKDIEAFMFLFFFIGVASFLTGLMLPIFDTDIAFDYNFDIETETVWDSITLPLQYAINFIGFIGHVLQIQTNIHGSFVYIIITPIFLVMLFVLIRLIRGTG